MRYYVLGFFLIGILVCGQAQYIEDKDVNPPGQLIEVYDTRTWKTAEIVPQAEWHLALTSPSRYGLLPKVELQSYLLAFPLLPNIALKKKWMESEILWTFSTKHGIYYPTQALKTLTRNGDYNMLEEDAKVPQIVTFQNEAIFSYILNPSCDKHTPHWVATGRLGMDFAITGDRDSSFTRMTYFSMYHRTAPYYGDKLFYAGLQLDGRVWENFYFTAGGDFYNVDFSSAFALEAQGSLILHLTQLTNISAGLKYHRGSNPLEKEGNFMLTLDFLYKLNYKRSPSKGLFDKKK